VIDELPRSLCGNKGGKNVILVVGDGMGWEMIRAGAIARKVVNELEELGCNIAAGCVGNTAAMARFEGRTLADYYTEGKYMMLLYSFVALLLLLKRVTHTAIYLFSIYLSIYLSICIISTIYRKGRRSLVSRTGGIRSGHDHFHCHAKAQRWQPLRSLPKSAPGRCFEPRRRHGSTGLGRLWQPD
jgi:uncharacterized membrane protein YeaQ/YmgE (transglycosylase-associated protein family)